MKYLLSPLVALTMLLAAQSLQSSASGVPPTPPLLSTSSLVLIESDGVYVVSMQSKVIERRSEFKNRLSMINFPIMSPDGTYIAYLYLDTSGPSNRHYLRIASQSGETLHSYPNVSADPVEWSLNSKSIVLWDFGSRQLKVLDVDSGQIRLLGGTEGSFDASVSPDLARVVYSSGESLKIYDTRSLERLVLTSGSMPTWSPNGKWITFIDEGKYFLISPSGKDRKLLGPASPRHTAAHWSPDSRFITYTRMVEPSDKIPLLPEYDDNYVVIVTSTVDFHSDWVYRHGGFFPRDFYWVTATRHP